MYGAIFGDIAGSPYEFNRGNKTKDFPLFSNESEYTDDTVMTIAIAEALLDAAGKSDEDLTLPMPKGRGSVKIYVVRLS